VTWNYGNFVTLVINFIIVAFCIFLVVKAVNKMKRPAPATSRSPKIARPVS
jgi:large conductance mechanosensitive channel